MKLQLNHEPFTELSCVTVRVSVLIKLSVKEFAICVKS